MTAEQTLESIPELILGYWKEYQKPWLLASLGGRLGPEARAKARESSETLGDYIEKNFGASVRLVQIPGHDKAAVPKDRAADLSDADLIQAFRMKKGRAANKRSYAREVWKAFFRPVTRGHRYLEVPITGEITLHETDEETIQDRWFEVSNSDLAGVDGLTGIERTKAIEASIIAWAEKSEIPIERLEASRIAKTAENFPAAVGWRSLVEGLAVLEPSELARISIPGDVFLSVLRRIS